MNFSVVDILLIQMRPPLSTHLHQWVLSSPYPFEASICIVHIHSRSRLKNSFDSFQHAKTYPSDSSGGWVFLFSKHFIKNTLLKTTLVIENARLNSSTTSRRLSSIELSEKLEWDTRESWRKWAFDEKQVQVGSSPNVLSELFIYVETTHAGDNWQGPSCHPTAVCTSRYRAWLMISLHRLSHSNSNFYACANLDRLFELNRFRFRTDSVQFSNSKFR